MAEDKKIKVTWDEIEEDRVTHVASEIHDIPDNTGFLVCPNCLNAYPAEMRCTTYCCRMCNFEWQPPINALGAVYLASIDELSVFLEDSSGESFQLKSLPAVIGRNSDFKSLQHNVSVSRQHCTIDFKQDTEIFTVTPFKTGSGTYLNGQLLKHDTAYPLYPGDSLVLSGIVLGLKCALTVEKNEKQSMATPEVAIPLSMCSPIGFVASCLHGNAHFTNDLTKDTIAAFIYNKGKNTWSVLGIDRQKISLNGNIFIERKLTGGENINIDGQCYVFNLAKASLEPDDVRSGAGIEIKNIQVGYSGKIVLCDLTCHIPQGKLTAILGQSGCGKSTLIKVLSGQKAQKSGQIIINGDASQNYRNWAAKHLSLVPQHDVIHSELTVKQCIEYAADIRIGKKAGAQLKNALVEKVIREAGLKNYTQSLIGELSGGQRKRVNIAVEIIGRPEVLLLDEPTTGLDYATEKQIIAGMRQMSRQGKTVVFVTHSLATIEVADHVIVLKSTSQGSRVVVEGTPSEVQRAIGVESWEELYSNINSVAACNHALLVEKQITYRAPGMSALFSRYLAIWLNSPVSSAALLFGLPLLLGMMIRFAVSIDAPIGTDRLIFGLVAMFWMGMNQTVREIVKEKKIFLQEHAHHVSSWTYLFSKIFFFLIISLPQSLLMTIPILWLNVNNNDSIIKIDQLNCPFLSVLPMMWLAGFTGCILGLFFSSLALFIKNKGEIAAVLFAVIATLPQFLFSAKVLPDGLAKSVTPEHFYKFICWHENAPIAEFLSYFTFSRYLFIPLDAISNGLSSTVVAKAFVFNGGILVIATISMLIVSWLLLEIYSVRSMKK